MRFSPHSSFRHMDWARPVGRLPALVAVGLAALVGLPRGVAQEQPAPAVKKVERPPRGTEPKAAPVDARKPRPTPGPSSIPRTKPPHRPAEHETTPPPGTPSGAEPGGTEGTGMEGPVSEAELDAAYEQMLKPAEERQYSISIQDGTYADLLDAFSRMSGLAILGDLPDGMVTYSSTEELDYKAALSRMRKILFNHPENFYIWREGNSLEVFRITEALRKMRPDQIHTSARAFLDADLDEMEIVLVLYTPEKGRVADLEQLRDFMPDYVRIAPYRDSNALTILALARDVKKYLELVRIFDMPDPDPRQFKALPLRYVLPSYAVEMLYLFMPALQEGGGAAPVPAAPPRQPRAGKGGQPQPVPSLEGVRGHGIDLIPYDEVKKLFVRAMPDKIAEIEKYLLIIDVAHGMREEPVTVSLQHVRVEQLMTLLQPLYAAEPVAPQQPSPKKRPRGQVQPTATGTVIVTEAIEIYPNPTNNTLIVFADDEALTKLRMYISLFDIPSQDRTVRVTLEHAEPEATVALVTEILQTLRPTSAGTLLVKSDPAGDGLILVGNPQDVALAQTVIADVDTAPGGPPPSIHVYKCKSATASSLVNLLTNLDREAAGAGAVPAPQPQPQPGGKKPRRAARAKAQGGTKYYGDDATASVYVICTDAEWEENYLPLLETLDRQAQAPNEVTIVPVAHSAPDQLINSLNLAFGAGKGAVPTPPTLLAHPNGIMVIGANETTLEQIRTMVREWDVDPQIERRTFSLQYADPNEVKTVLEALLVQAPGAAPRPRGGKKGQPAPAPAPASGGAPSIQIVPSGRTDLIVVAPAADMIEIAELIAQLDVDPVNLTTKVYDFPPGTNLQELAQTLSAFYPDSAAVPVPAPAPEGGPKGGRARRAVVAAKPGDLRFVPVPSAHKLIVSAPAALIPDIEEKIAILRPDGEETGSKFAFFSVVHLDPQSMADTLAPLLDLEYQRLVGLGEVTVPAGPERGQAVKAVSITPDPRGDRIIVVAPGKLLESVPSLLEQLDRPDRERIHKTIALEKADPKEMVQVIQAMLSARPTPTSGPAVPPGPEGPRPGKGRRGGPPPPPRRGQQAGGSQDVTIIEAPGGTGVLVAGYAEDVALVDLWIKDLDQASGGGRQIKIYKPKNIDVEKFADAVMTLVDSGGGAGGGGPKAAVGKGKDKEESFFDISMGGPRRGKDIYLVTDSWVGTMLVSATPAKLREVDELYAMYEGTPDGKAPLLSATSQEPIDTYELQHREDTFDAVWALESVIDSLWYDPSNKPKIDYIPFTKIVTIRCRPQDFDRVRELIRKYVDKPGEKKPAKEDIAVVPVSNMKASDWAIMVLNRIEPGTARIEGLSLDEEAYDVEEVKPEPKSKTKSTPTTLPAAKDKEDARGKAQPYVLPVSAQLWITTAASALPDGPKQLGAQDPPNSSKLDQEVERLKREILESLKDDGKSSAAPARPADKTGTTQPASPTTAPAADSAPLWPATTQPGAGVPVPAEPPLLIIPDNEKGALIFKGPSRLVTDAKELVEKIAKELEDIPQPPDIRVFQVKFVDVNTASDILEAMFNAPRQRGMTPQQMQQIMQQQQLAAQQRQRGQQPPGQGQEEEKGGKGRRPKEGEEQLPQPTAAQEPGQIRVYPDARTHTLIIRAAPEQYPAVTKLLATIDRKGTAADFRIYTLKRLNAAEVEAKLKEMLGLDQRAARQVQRQPMPGRQPGMPPVPVPGGQPVEIMMDMGGESMTLSAAERVTISSNAATNTIMAMAPEKTLNLIGELIQQLEGQEAPEMMTRTYALAHADATEVATQLDKSFAAKKGGKVGEVGWDPMDVNNPIFTADARTNSIIVRALEPDLPKIEPLIQQLDQETGDDKPRFLKLVNAKPSDIAKKLQEAFGSGAAGKGGKGKGAKVTITGDDASMQLIIVAPESVFADIQEMVSKIDVPRTNLEFRTYSLTYARAPEVLKQMTELVRALVTTGKQGGVDLGVFSAVADESTNALVVAGEPTIFPIVQSVLAKIDIQPPESAAIETRVYRLVSAQAEDVANTINKLFGQVRKGGIEPARAEANPSTNTVLVRGTKNQQDEIFTQVIKPLDDFADQPLANLKQEVIDLQFAKADDVATQLNDWFKNQQQALKGAGVKGLNPSDMTVAITPEVNSNKLLVLANDKNMALIKDRVAAMDKKDVGDRSARAIQTYVLKYADPNAVAQIIGKQFQPSGVGKVAEKDRVDASAEQATQSLVVTASPANQEKIAAFITTLDVDAGGGQMREIVTMVNARASEVANAVNQSISQSRQQPGRQARRPVSVVANDALNQVIVAGAREDVDDVVPLVQKLDQKPVDELNMVTQVYDVKYVDPGSLLNTIKESFSPQGRQPRPQDQVRASYAAGTSSLVVTASPENQKKVKDILDRVDVESSTLRSTHVVKLKMANAEDLAQRLTQVYQKTQKVRRDDVGVSITAEAASNSLLVYANETEFAQVQELITILDVRPEEQRQIRSFKLTYAEAWDLQEAVKQLFGGAKGGQRASPRDMVDVYPSYTANALVVAASPENMARVEAFVTEVDKPGTGDRKVTVVTLRNSDAGATAKALQDMFVRARQGRQGQETISISNPQGSNAVLIRANEKELAEIQAAIEQVEATGSAAGGQMKVITLNYIDAEEAKTIVEEYLRKPGTQAGGGRGGAANLVGDLRLSISAATNSLIVSGNPEQLEQANNVIAQIDVESEVGGVRLIKLKHARATDIQPVLEELFKQQAQRSKPGGAAAIQPVIEANDETNTLLVRAGRSDFKSLERLVADLDTEAGVEPYRIVQVAQGVNVEDLSAMLEETFNAKGTAGGGRAAGKGMVAQLIVTPDRRTNSVMLAGAPALFDKVEEVIHKYEEMGPPGGEEMIIIRLENQEAGDMEGIIRGMIEDNTGGGAGASKPKRSPSRPPAPRPSPTPSPRPRPRSGR